MIKALGVRQLKNYLAGKPLTNREAIIAKCADCMNGFADGKIDCEIPECPLYPLMPYGNPSFRKPRSQRKGNPTFKKKSEG
jgi:hypothetical protein